MKNKRVAYRVDQWSNVHLSILQRNELLNLGTFVFGWAVLLWVIQSVPQPQVLDICRDVKGTKVCAVYCKSYPWTSYIKSNTATDATTFPLGDRGWSTSTTILLDAYIQPIYLFKKVLKACTQVCQIFEVYMTPWKYPVILHSYLPTGILKTDAMIIHG